MTIRELALDRSHPPWQTKNSQSKVSEGLHARFPKVIEALASLGGDFVFDGDWWPSIRKGGPQTLRKVLPDFQAIVHDFGPRPFAPGPAQSGGS